MSAAIPARPAGGRRPGAPIIALAAGAVFGIAQTLVAQRGGLLRFDGSQSGWLAIELSMLTWLSAVNVVVGVLAGARFGRQAGFGRTDLFAIGGAGLGGLLAVPVASSAVAWAAVYGGGVAASRAAVQVVIGTLLGMLAGLLAQRYRTVAVGLLAGSVLVWLVAALSALLGPDRPPVLGHPDISLAPGHDVAAQRAGALAVAVVYGLVLGAAWAQRRAEARIAAVAGPILVAAAYLATVPLTGPSWPWSPLPTALLAVPAAGLGAAAGGWLTDRLRGSRTADRHDGP
jgi:hypothetical protein